MRIRYLPRYANANKKLGEEQVLNNLSKLDAGVLFVLPDEKAAVKSGRSGRGTCG